MSLHRYTAYKYSACWYAAKGILADCGNRRIWRTKSTKCWRHNVLGSAKLICTKRLLEIGASSPESSQSTSLDTLQRKHWCYVYIAN
jgi:hypothetical protein